VGIGLVEGWGKRTFDEDWERSWVSCGLREQAEPGFLYDLEVSRVANRLHEAPNALEEAQENREIRLRLGLWLLILARTALFADELPLSVSDLKGNPQTLESYRGRIVVLNFWATWCVPCRAEMPLLADLKDRYAQRGVVVVGASTDDETTKDQIKPFIEKLGISFPIWTGATTGHMEQFGLGKALPATAILDEQGAVAFRILGVLKRKDLTRRIDFLLSGRKGKAPEETLDLLSEEAEKHQGHDHGEEEEEHAHGGVGVEGASLVPS
jgi:thiol-disulfide isomerase/thioredoxin